MKAVRIRVPKEVIKNEGNILHRSIMAGVGIEEEIVAKGFQDQDRAFNKGIVPGQEFVVPEKLTL